MPRAPSSPNTSARVASSPFASACATRARPRRSVATTGRSASLLWIEGQLAPASSASVRSRSPSRSMPRTRLRASTASSPIARQRRFTSRRSCWASAGSAPAARCVFCATAGSPGRSAQAARSTTRASPPSPPAPGCAASTTASGRRRPIARAGTSRTSSRWRAGARGTLPRGPARVRPRHGRRLPAPRRRRRADRGRGAPRDAARARGEARARAGARRARRRAEPAARGVRRRARRARWRAHGAPVPGGLVQLVPLLRRGQRGRRCCAISTRSRRRASRSRSTSCSSTTATSARSATGSRRTSGFRAGSPRSRARSAAPASAPASGPPRSAWCRRAASSRRTPTGCSAAPTARFRGLVHPGWTREGWVYALDPSREEVRAPPDAACGALAGDRLLVPEARLPLRGGDAGDARTTRASRAPGACAAVSRRSAPARATRPSCSAAAARSAPPSAWSTACASDPTSRRAGASRASCAHPGARADAALDAANAIRNVLTRAWMHRRLWLNDPDCLMVRRTRHEAVLRRARPRSRPRSRRAAAWCCSPTTSARLGSEETQLACATPSRWRARSTTAARTAPRARSVCSTRRRLAGSWAGAESAALAFAAQLGRRAARAVCDASRRGAHGGAFDAAPGARRARLRG